MPNRASLILSLGIMAVSGYAIVAALGWPLKTQLFPLVISVPLFILGALEAAWVWFSGPRFAQTKDFQRPPSEVPASLARQRTLRAWGWIFGFFLATILVGFPVAVPLFVFLYLKLEARESWLFSLIFAGIVWACFYGFLDRLLHLPFASGLLF